jgi:hypothetical protein
MATMARQTPRESLEGGANRISLLRPNPAAKEKEAMGAAGHTVSLLDCGDRRGRISGGATQNAGL